jgi:amidohydrolase
MTMLDRATALQEDLVNWRRDIHRHPERGFQELRTAALVADVLCALDYRVRTGVGRTGVVAERGEGGPVVAIRADMDALPLQEENDVPYASQVPGVMHACGHDAHTAIALGVATLLAEDALDGTVRFLFQPAEEMEDDEGLSGASRMVEDGALDGVDAIIGLHVHGGAPVGQIEVGAGPASAGVDSFWASIEGRGGHGAYPHRALDPIHIASHVVLALHGIVSRRLNPFASAVISVGSIHGGQANNVIPERVDLAGTIRYLEPDIQALLHAEIERALALAHTLGGDSTLRIHKGAPPVVNDADVVDVIQQVAQGLLGPGCLRAPERGMGGEDFSIFTNRVPGAMFRLGCELEGDRRDIHNPNFDLDERCLPIGVAILVETALHLLAA